VLHGSSVVLLAQHVLDAAFVAGAETDQVVDPVLLGFEVLVLAQRLVKRAFC
jgi:hypothetical protein